MGRYVRPSRHGAPAQESDLPTTRASITMYVSQLMRRTEKNVVKEAQRREQQPRWVIGEVPGLEFTTATLPIFACHCETQAHKGCECSNGCAPDEGAGPRVDGVHLADDHLVVHQQLVRDVQRHHRHLRHETITVGKLGTSRPVSGKRGKRSRLSWNTSRRSS